MRIAAIFLLALLLASPAEAMKRTVVAIPQQNPLTFTMIADAAKAHGVPLVPLLGILERFDFKINYIHTI